MKKRLLFTAVLILIPVSSALAVTGGAFMKHCRSVTVNSSDYLRCSSYVIGVVDNMRSNKAGDIGFQNICIPQKINESEVIQMTLNWLENNPKSWDMWAAFAVTMVMAENYPCGCD